MKLLVGLGFLVAAALVAVFGDRTVQAKTGAVAKAFSWPGGSASLLKYPIAAVLGGVGIWFLLRGAE